MAQKKRDSKKTRKGLKGSRSGKSRRSASKRPQPPIEEPVNCTHMQALSHRGRIPILAILCERIASPKEISEILKERLSQVSYHVKVLRESGLIELDHTEPRRGATEHFYRATSPTIVPPDAWNHLPPAVRKGISVRILQHFFEDASASMEAGVFDSSPGELSWTPLILDTHGVQEFGKLSRNFQKSVVELQASADKRLSKSPQSGSIAAATVFLASFLSVRDPRNGTKASATKRR